MVWGRVRHLFLALLVAASPPALLADDCPSSSVSGVRLSASSYRNQTGHWITKVALTRRSSRDVGDLQQEERPFDYDVDVTRQSCSDDETLTTVFTVVAPPSRVGADYKFFPKVGYYKLHTDKMNWENARRKCAKEGAHLAIVNSEVEENAIREMMKASLTKIINAFIGFHDKFKEGEYVTIFGDPLISTGRVNWAKSEPNDAKTDDFPEGEDCGAIYPHGHINDNACARELPFLCEQSL